MQNNQETLINRPLWANNKICVCGESTNPDIKSCETGLNYCSNECAKTHVHEIWDPVTEKVKVDLSGFWLGGF